MNDFIIQESHATYLNISVALLLIMPLILVGIRKKLFDNFTYKNLVETLNRTLYFEVIIALFVILLIYILQKTTNPNNGGISLFAIELSFLFLILLILIVPIIILLNIVKYFVYRNRNIGSL